MGRLFRHQKVKLENLAKQIRREALANPKKAGFLGVATLVAAYFWMPLVWGWIGKGNQGAAVAGVVPHAASTIGVDHVAVSKTTNHPSWQQIVRAMHNDPRTMSAPTRTQTRNPFEPTGEAIAEAAAMEKARRPSTATPQSLGLVLTSTILGPQRRVARISGKTYSIGQTIEVSAKDSATATFTLVDVQPRRVVLQNDSQRHELSIPEPSNSAKMDFEFSSP